MWGTLAYEFLESSRDRFIPTCVGNTHYLPSRSLYTSVHPHVCGEHISSGLWVFLNAGSSPRVWGTPRSFPPSVQITRFIPTCVGNTQINRQALFMQAVHPHVCGEHDLYEAKPPGFNGSSPRVWGTLIKEMVSDANSMPMSGSSPRVWGTPVSNNNNNAKNRFIPTCVGNT